ncbi:MAG: Rne/Rng family ribonuclease [Proteobacteria bacterium]|nr:Rne/Rng family ribonuclease [Pseudomonadota bacterium]
MNKELVVNVFENETRVALLENKNIVELYIDRGDDSNINGNIYKGRVQRVLPGMQAAFIDVGLKQAAFIHVNDLIKRDIHDIEEDDIFNDEIEEVDEDKISYKQKKKDINKENHSIEDYIKEGQEILVQVAKSPISTKGARVTCHISLPGRYLVLMPTVDHIGISRRIEDEGERERLKELILSLRKDNMGYIFRTAGEAIESENLLNEMELLSNSWEKIKEKSIGASVPTLIHKDLTITLRAMRDLLTHEAKKLIIDSRSVFEIAQSFLKEIMPELNVSIEYYDDKEPIFDVYNLEGDIFRALKNKVWLKSGGYIIIEQTEALVSIDINTGRYVGKFNFEETILKTNLEAVKEIAYQIRLRNIGGIIVIDFIDMEKQSHQEKVYNALVGQLGKDKCKTNILPMSDIGLVQMTRKRVRKSLNRMMCEPCSNCSGQAYTLSKESASYKLFREIIRQSNDFMGSKLIIKVNPELADYIHSNEMKIINGFELRYKIIIEIFPKSEFHIEEFDITESY